jgi:starch phosphorylase
MVRHTLKSLGPKVLASRMVRDYVRQVYAPAAHNARALNSDFHGAAELAAWKKKVRSGWSSVQVEHVETGGVGDAPEVGANLTVRAFVSLGDLMPADVDVQVVHGRTTSEDLLEDSEVTPMELTETYEGGRYRFDATILIDHSGPFGYTVRVVPSHESLASVAELGLVAEPTDQPV